MWAKDYPEDFLLQEGFLFKGSRLCIPRTSLRDQLLRELHVGGLAAHLGRENFCCFGFFFWPKMRRDVTRFI